MYKHFYRPCVGMPGWVVGQVMGRAEGRIKWDKTVSDCVVLLSMALKNTCWVTVITCNDCDHSKSCRFAMGWERFRKKVN